MTLIDYLSFVCFFRTFFLSLRFQLRQITLRLPWNGLHIIEKRLEFERRRKLHYNEFEAVRLARQLMEQDELDDEIIDVDETHSAT